MYPWSHEKWHSVSNTLSGVLQVMEPWRGGLMAGHVFTGKLEENILLYSFILFILFIIFLYGI